MVSLKKKMLYNRKICNHIGSCKSFFMGKRKGKKDLSGCGAGLSG